MRKQGLQRKPSRKALMLGLRKGTAPTQRELRLLQKGASPEVIARQRQIERIIGENRQAFRKRFAVLKERKWPSDRDLSRHNLLFSQVLGKPIETMLEEISRKTKAPLRILDEGAGHGTALKELKEKLAERNIKTETTGVSINKYASLTNYRKAGKVDRVVEAPTEKFVPIRKYHLIISVYGGLQYLQYDARLSHSARKKLFKEVLLKYSYSLENNGIALIGFDRNKIIYNDWEGFKEEVKHSMKKRGFEIYFKEKSQLSFPENCIMITRLR